MRKPLVQIALIAALLGALGVGFISGRASAKPRGTLLHFPKYSEERNATYRILCVSPIGKKIFLDGIKLESQEADPSRFLYRIELPFETKHTLVCVDDATNAMTSSVFEVSPQNRFVFVEFNGSDVSIQFTEKSVGFL